MANEIENVVTRFDVRETEEGDEIRLFNKRTKLFAFGADDVVLEDWEQKLAAYIAEKPRTSEDCEAFLTEEPEDDDEEEEAGRSIVPKKYRIRYEAAQNCGDEIALALTNYVTPPRAKENDDGRLDRVKLREVAAVNGIADNLAKWEGRELKGGLLRMNTGNVLRGMNRRGERVQIGERVWEAREVEKNPRKRATKKEG